MQDDSYYHIYNRGADRRPVFLEPRDYSRMFDLFDRYLGIEERRNDRGRTYPYFRASVKLLAFCLMPNHFHLYLNAAEPEQVSKFMQSLKTAYCRYFNERYERSGVLFETRYNRRLINDEADYLQMSRYIHLNALAITADYDKYPYSSLRYYLYEAPPPWLTTAPILECFETPAEYKAFHEARIRELAFIALQV